MASILSFGRTKSALSPAQGDIAGFIDGFSIEVMPRTAAKIPDFRAILPADTLVYVAHIDGTPIEDMLATTARLIDEGFPVMPHIPARVIPDANSFDRWVKSYADQGVDQALLLGGGLDKPNGPFDNSMQLLDSGLFDTRGFKALHVAGHPEGNRDIDPGGGDKSVMDALRWKTEFSKRTDAKMAIATQFCFEAEPVIAWADALRAADIDLPIHIGIAGPAKLQTMIKFAMACGVGPSLRVLQRRAKDVTKLVLPFTPHDILADLAAHTAANPDCQIEKVHFFPLGGITKTAEFTAEFGHGGAGQSKQTA